MHKCTKARFNRINITYLLRYPTHYLSLQPHIICLLLFLHNTKIHSHNSLFISLFLQLNLLFSYLDKFFFICNSLMFKCKGFTEPLLFLALSQLSVFLLCPHIFQCCCHTFLLLLQQCCFSFFISIRPCQLNILYALDPTCSYFTWYPCSSS
jgi:hypothetical protein